MLAETNITGSDDWWVMKGMTELGNGFPRLGNLKRYRVGDAPVADDASPAVRAAYVKFIKRGRLHLADLIVSSRTNRQKPIGFRTAAVGDDVGDDAAWANWKRTHMKSGVRTLLDDVGHYGSGFLTVTGSALPGSGDYAGKFSEPSMVPSNGWTTWTSQFVTMPWLAETMVQIGFDPINLCDIVTLFRPGYMRIARLPTQTTTIPTDGTAWRPSNQFTWESGPVSLGFTADVPGVRLDAPDGFGYYEKHLDSIDRVNDEIKSRLTIVAMQAFRQRVLKGDLPTVYPEDHERAGEKIDYDEIFKAGPAALWMIPETADIWESTPTDFTPLISATKEDIKYLAAVTSTPLYVLSPDSVTGSATGASVAKEAHRFEVEASNETTADVLALGHALMFAAQRDTERADAAEIETIWASIDSTSWLERSQAASYAKTGGLPQRMIDEKIFALTPAEQRQAIQDRQDDIFNSPSGGDVTPVVTATPPAVVPADATLVDAAAVAPADNAAA